MNIPIVDVGGKRTLEYVAECITKINRGTDILKVRAIGGSISKGVRVVQILQDYFSENIELTASISDVVIEGSENSCLEIDVIVKNLIEVNKELKFDSFIKKSDSFFNKRIISFPVYNTLLDYLLYSNNNLVFSFGNKAIGKVVIEKNGYFFRCKPPESDKFNKYLIEVYYRSGLLESNNWKEVAKKMSSNDDVILGFDTNILRSAVFTEHFLDGLFYFDPKKYTHTPNWITLIIPTAVMHELEQASNCRDDSGLLEPKGRMGFRAMAEILEISHCIDLAGISLIIFGETDTTLDVRAEMYDLKELIVKTANNVKIKSRISSTGDTIIRDQFKRFLKEVDFFGGGAYFLTADKTCAALAKTEGLNSVYYKPPYKESINKTISPICLHTENTKNIQLPIPIGKLVYEFCVQFGEIEVSWTSVNNEEQSIHLYCDKKGESLDHWLFRDLFITGGDATKLIKEYSGKFSLEYLANKVWKDVRHELIKTDFD